MSNYNVVAWLESKGYDPMTVAGLNLEVAPRGPSVLTFAVVIPLDGEDLAELVAAIQRDAEADS